MYSEPFQIQAELLKALAHPRRLEIIHLLREHELCVSDIYEMLDLPQANISQHLMVLREAGVVITTKSGKQIFYTLSSPKILYASDLIREVLIEQHSGSPLASELALSMQELLPLVHDPVCKMRISPKTASFSTTIGDETYFFCASGCHTKFLKDQKKYVK